MEPWAMPKWDSYKETSTGIGHVYRAPVPCTVVVPKGVRGSPVLQSHSSVLPLRHFSTVYRLDHDDKPPKGLFSNPVLSRPAPHWTTNYLCQLSEKLSNSNAVRMLPPPCSESCDRYRAFSAPARSLPQRSGTQLASYRQLERDQLPAVEVPCLSTAQSDYRYFSRSELSHSGGLSVVATTNSQSQKKSRTYSSMPTHKAPPTVSYHPRESCPLKSLPHRGKTSLYTESYTAAGLPSTVTASVTTPDWSEVKTDIRTGLLLNVVEVPQMYTTESKNYGGNCVVLL